MLGEDDGIAGINKSFDLNHQLVHIGRMQTDRRLIDDVQGRTAGYALQLSCKLDALRLAARELRRGLPEFQVPEADVLQQSQRPLDGRVLCKELTGQIHAHGQNLRDVLAVKQYLEGGFVIARSVTDGTGCIHTRHEQQLDTHEALTLAGRTAASVDVEGEPAGGVASRLCRGGCGKQPTHLIEESRIGRQIRSRRAADWLLVHGNHALHGVGTRTDASLRELRGTQHRLLGYVLLNRRLWANHAVREQVGERLTHQTRFTGAGHPRHHRQHTDGKRYVELAQIIAGDVLQFQPAARGARLPGHRLNGGEQISRRLRLGNLAQAAERPAVEHPAAIGAGARSHVHDPLRTAHDIEIVFDHEQRVAGELQLLQCLQQRLGVGRMQPRGWLIQHVHHAE